MSTLVAALALLASFVHPVQAHPQRQLAAASPRVQPVYTAPTSIRAFAQDGSYLAWFTPGKRTCNAVHLLYLANGTQVSLPDETPNAPNVTCRWEVGPTEPVGLALAVGAGVDVLWTLREVAPVQFQYILGAGVNGSGLEAMRERRFKEVAHTNRGTGLWLGGIAGDDSTLVYALTAVSYVDEVACLSGNSCAMKLAGGGVFRLSGRKAVPIADTSAAVAVAAWKQWIAIVPASAKIGKDGAPQPANDQPIEVRDARTGALVSKVAPQGTPVAIALSDTALAALERTPAGLQLATYDPVSGDSTGSVAVPAGTSPQLSASSSLVVFRVGRSIRGLDLATRRVKRLATAAATPIGLSVEGGRVAWAENVDGRGRICALYVGGRG